MWSHPSGHLWNVSGLGLWKWVIGRDLLWARSGMNKQTCWNVSRAVHQLSPRCWEVCALAPFLSLSVIFFHRFGVCCQEVLEGIGVVASVWMGNPHHSSHDGNSLLFWGPIYLHAMLLQAWSGVCVHQKIGSDRNRITEYILYIL